MWWQGHQGSQFGGHYFEYAVPGAADSKKSTFSHLQLHREFIGDIAKQTFPTLKS
jgi:hypothetical protein